MVTIGEGFPGDVEVGVADDEGLHMSGCFTRQTGLQISEFLALGEDKAVSDCCLERVTE